MTRVDLPSVLQPWDPAPIRALRGFPREAIRERARLALTDPDTEAEAVRPMTPVRARWILMTMADQEAAQAAQDATRRQARPVDRRPDGRDLLDRLGVDPNRGRGVTRCPAHEDRHASLSWKLADDGRALLHCFAGCEFREILAAIA